MKKQFFYIAAVLVLISISCNNNDKDDSVRATGDSIPDSPPAMNPGDSTVSTSPDTNTQRETPVYMEVKSNKSVKIKRDEQTHSYVNAMTGQPLSFYYDPVNHDTFDSRGRIVSNALLLKNGVYSIDETKLKSKDDAIKMKNDQVKLKMNGVDGTIKDKEIKIKDKDDLYKEKTDSTKLKVKSDKMKMKSK